MTKYLIEIPHSESAFECKQVIKLFVTSGSHLLSNAHWGCKDGVHKAWFIADFDSKEQALQVVPAYLKPDAKIIELVKFNKDDMAQWAEQDKS